jgi:4-hydroxybenzoate polyprenyltransferase
MRKLKAIIQLIRLPNLVFIALTQYLTFFFIIQPSLHNKATTIPLFYVHFLILSTLLIAAAGYIINDYFDIRIDSINKPERVTIEKIFKRRTIITWHILLNFIALFITSYLALHFILLRVVGLQIIIILLLVVYSTTFKRKLISGNFLISILTSLTLICMALYEPKFILFNLDSTSMKLFWLYVLFAFIITFIREIIKDAEDIKGDLMQNCKTIPLVFGVNGAKRVVYFLIAFLLLTELITFYYLRNMAIIAILGIGTCLPLLVLIPQLMSANTSIQFKQISTYLKLITLIGILSIIFV